MKIFKFLPVFSMTNGQTLCSNGIFQINCGSDLNIEIAGWLRESGPKLFWTVHFPLRWELFMTHNIFIQLILHAWQIHIQRCPLQTFN